MKITKLNREIVMDFNGDEEMDVQWYDVDGVKLGLVDPDDKYPDVVDEDVFPARQSRTTQNLVRFHSGLEMITW